MLRKQNLLTTWNMKCQLYITSKQYYYGDQHRIWYLKNCSQMLQHQKILWQSFHRNEVDCYKMAHLKSKKSWKKMVHNSPLADPVDKSRGAQNIYFQFSLEYAWCREAPFDIVIFIWKHKFIVRMLKWSHRSCF